MNYTKFSVSSTETQKAKIDRVARKVAVNRSWLLLELFEFALTKIDMKELRIKADTDKSSRPHGRL